MARNILDFDPAVPVSFVAASADPAEQSSSTVAPQSSRRYSRRPTHPSANEEQRPADTPASRKRRSRARPNEDDDVDAYDIATVCRRAGVGRTFVYEAINRGELIARKPGEKTRLIRILRTDFEAWLESWPKIVPANTAASPASPVASGDGSDHDPEFRELYGDALGLQAMRWAEEVLAIADDRTLDPHDRRIRVDTRIWLLSKLLPKIYGDRVTVAGDAKAPIHHVVEIADLAALSDAELDALEAFADARLAAIAAQQHGD